MMQITDGVTAAARRTARLLVSEIRLFHEPAVTEGRRHRNLLTRLAPEIEKARQAYNEQVPPVSAPIRITFTRSSIQTLAGGDATLLGNLSLTMKSPLDRGGRRGIGRRHAVRSTTRRARARRHHHPCEAVADRASAGARTICRRCGWCPSRAPSSDRR